MQRYTWHQARIAGQSHPAQMPVDHGDIDGACSHLTEGSVSRILKTRVRGYLGDLVKRGTVTAEEAETIVRQMSAHSVRRLSRIFSRPGWISVQ